MSDAPTQKEIIDRARRLLAARGKTFDTQVELMLYGLSYAVILVDFGDALMVYYDTPRVLTVASTAEVNPGDEVCDLTERKVLELLRAEMVLEDLADV